MTFSDWVMLFSALAPIAFMGIAGAIGWALRAYARSVTQAIAEVGKDVARLEGRLHALDDGLEKATHTMTAVSAELKAVWRFIDGANERASDMWNRGGR